MDPTKNMTAREKLTYQLDEMGAKVLKDLEKKYDETFTIQSSDLFGNYYEFYIISDRFPDDTINVRYFTDKRNYPLRDNYPAILIGKDLEDRMGKIVAEEFPEYKIWARISALEFNPSVNKKTTYEELVELDGVPTIHLKIWVINSVAREEQIDKLIQDLEKTDYICYTTVFFVYEDMKEEFKTASIEEIREIRTNWHQEYCSFYIIPDEFGETKFDGDLTWHDIGNPKRPEK